MQFKIVKKLNKKGWIAKIVVGKTDKYKKYGFKSENEETLLLVESKRFIISIDKLDEESIKIATAKISKTLKEKTSSFGIEVIDTENRDILINFIEGLILGNYQFDKYKSRIKFLETKWADKMAKGGNHQGILIDMEDIKFNEISQIKQGSFIVILDGITDVGNIGAIVRSAYAMGVDAIIATGVRQLNYGAITRTTPYGGDGPDYSMM